MAVTRSISVAGAFMSVVLLMVAAVLLWFISRTVLNRLAHYVTGNPSRLTTPDAAAGPEAELPPTTPADTVRPARLSCSMRVLPRSWRAAAGWGGASCASFRHASDHRVVGLLGLPPSLPECCAEPHPVGVVLGRVVRLGSVICRPGHTPRDAVITA